jgi:hypothetical protein
MDASLGVASWERVGQLAAQLSACATDIEQFLLHEADHMRAVQRLLGQLPREPRHRSHPGCSDPVIAAVLTRFEQLERAAGEGDGKVTG